MQSLVGVYDEIEDCLPSFLELYQIVRCQEIGKNEIINLLKLADRGELPYLQEKSDCLRDQIYKLEIELKNKESRLFMLNNELVLKTSIHCPHILRLGVNP